MNEQYSPGKMFSLWPLMKLCQIRMHQHIDAPHDQSPLLILSIYRHRIRCILY